MPCRACFTLACFILQMPFGECRILQTITRCRRCVVSLQIWSNVTPFLHPFPTFSARLQTCHMMVLYYRQIHAEDAIHEVSLIQMSVDSSLRHYRLLFRSHRSQDLYRCCIWLNYSILLDVTVFTSHSAKYGARTLRTWHTVCVFMPHYVS